MFFLNLSSVAKFVHISVLGIFSLIKLLSQILKSVISAKSVILDIIWQLMVVAKKNTNMHPYELKLLNSPCYTVISIVNFVGSL